ncbi:myeloid leukemia factor 1 isoform X1 [Fundulus heteroclitus]|uniref:myeloid leukemia factor 1 isoform X1 n=1 Tax=Fundulus heteroclitus TaxID=8078 RepID=UPI00165AED97|nr:myeloid leukemia factor 1 isoform X1 [Fundulus heteroclitus]
MFNSMLRDFDEDPFFSDPFHAHREHMRQMMRSFSEPFGAPLMPSITDGRNRGREAAEYPSSSPTLRNEHRDMSRSLLPLGSAGSTELTQNPFSMFDSMMSNMRHRMEEMNRNFENVSADSDTHAFRSSSVMTYSKVGNEPPKVFQATSSTRCAPGGIKETRQAIKDSESGLEKMKIGHHIKDRGHVVEKKHNRKTGEKEFNQDFQNMDESEAQSFDDEWQEEVSRFQSAAPMSNIMQPRLRAAHHAALPGPEQPHRDKRKNNSGAKGSGNTKK